MDDNRRDPSCRMSTSPYQSLHYAQSISPANIWEEYSTSFDQNVSIISQDPYCYTITYTTVSPYSYSILYLQEQVSIANVNLYSNNLQTSSTSRFFDIQDDYSLTNSTFQTTDYISCARHHIFTSLSTISSLILCTLITQLSFSIILI